MNDVMDWQRRFRAGPAVWAVMDDSGGVVDLYESKEAAAHHINFLRRFNRRGYSVHMINIHTEELARERWSVRDAGAGANGEPGGGK